MLDLFRAGKLTATLFLVIILVGCAPQKPLTDQAVGIKPLQSPTLEKSTQSGFSKVTPTLNNLVNTNPTPEQLLTKTVEPTRVIQDQRTYILDLIRTNGNCKFPCFLSITPGQSTWEMAKSLILSTGAKYSDKIESDGIHHFTGFDTKDLQIPMLIEFIETHGVIEYVSAGIGHLNDNLPPGIDWTPYQLSSVLQSQGVPSHILLVIGLPVEPPLNSANYGLFLIYDHPEMIFEYGGGPVEVEPIIHVCPNIMDRGGIDSMNLFVKSSNFPDWPTNMRDVEMGTHELEYVSNMTVKQFYNTYKEKNATNCIASRSSNWTQSGK
jgi:hypothetical protein